MKLSSFLLFLLLVVLIGGGGGASASSSASIVHTLPGFSGPLPFKLETGYIGVDDDEDIQVFYYFVESENDPETDPLIFWLTGGQSCSGLSSLVYESGPVKFDGSLPILKLNPYSWSKHSSVIYFDSLAWTGFSYSASSKDYIYSETNATQLNYSFLRKWLLSHPTFIKNRLFIAGSSTGGMITSMLALKVAEGNEAGVEPIIRLEGYIIGNSAIDMDLEFNERVPYAHRMGLISDDYYEMAKANCHGQYINTDPNNKPCNQALELIHMCTKDVFIAHILEPKCPSEYEDDGSLIRLPNQDEPQCRDDTYVSSILWANNEAVRDSLHVRKGTIGEWERCPSNHTYIYNVRNVWNSRKLLNEKDIDGLVYNGDQDMIVPYFASLKGVRSLNFSLYEAWRPWKVNLQVAGYTEKYKNGDAYVTFATVKGGGHGAPEQRPKECSEMIRRFTSGSPL